MLSDTQPVNKIEERFSPLSGPQSSSLENEIAARAVMDVLEDNSFNTYLTSPLDSPWEEDLLTTPSLIPGGDAEVDILTSPALLDNGETFTDFPLFPDEPLFGLTFDKLNTSRQENHLSTPLTYDSPSSSAMDPHSLRASPESVSERPTTPSVTAGRGVAKASRTGSGSRRKSKPTGTRKNVTPECLIPLEAPIQPRKYVTSSVTSRKELPAVFARKRKRAMAFEADHDEEDQPVGDHPLKASPTPSELSAIETKRRQNTLAARRSRKRKLEYQRDMEATVENEREEKEAWKGRAMAFHALLQSHGIKIPPELEVERR